MNTPSVRSTFVTVVAWVFIGLAGFASLIAVLQNIMVELVFLPAMHQAATPAPVLPGPFGWFSNHFAWFFRAFLLLALMTLTAAIGLLLRKNWARRLFIGLLVFAIIYQLFGLAVQWWMADFMHEAMATPPDAPKDFEQGMRIMLVAMRVFGALLAVGISTLFAWLIYRLRRPAVLEEFGQPSSAAA